MNMLNELIEKREALRLLTKQLAGGSRNETCFTFEISAGSY